MQPDEWGVNVQTYSGSPANFAVFSGRFSVIVNFIYAIMCYTLTRLFCRFRTLCALDSCSNLIFTEVLWWWQVVDNIFQISPFQHQVIQNLDTSLDNSEIYQQNANGVTI